MKHELRDRLDQLAVARTGQTTGAVLELANDFTHADQTIDGRDIAAIKYSPQTPHDAGILPRRKGELWVQIAEGTTDKLLRMWVGIAVTGAEAKWEEVAARTANAAILDVANNFTETDQRINKSQIVTVKNFITEFPTSSPEFEGQLAVCRSDPGDFLQLYIAYTGEEGILTWTSVTTDDLADTVVMTDQVNNFTEYVQTLEGNQILSFINGGEHDPSSSGIAPQHDGQLYIAFKTFESGRRDIAVWVANKSTWCPLMVDAAGLAKLREHNEFLGSNSFTDIRQYIGPLEESRRIAAVRRVTGLHNPIVTPDLAPRMAGEFLIWEKEGSSPQEVSLFVSISGSNSGDLVSTVAWRLIWNSVGGSVDLSNVAKLDTSNIFTRPQFIGEEGRRHATFLTGRQGVRDPMNDASLDLVPFAAGDTYVREFNDAGATEHQVWTASHVGDSASWLLTFDSRESTTALAGKITLVEENLDAFKDVTVTDMDNMSTTLGTLDSEMTDVQETLKTTNAIVDGFTDALEATNELVHQNTGRLDAFDTVLTPEFTDLPETVAGHTTSIAANARDIETINLALGGEEGLLLLPGRMREVERDLFDAEASISTHTRDITKLKTDVDQSEQNIANQSGKLAEHGLKILDHSTEISDNHVAVGLLEKRVRSLEHGSYSLGSVHTTAVPVADLHKYEALVFKHLDVLTHALPVVNDTLDELGNILEGNIATGHYIPVFNLSEHPLTFTGRIYESHTGFYSTSFEMPKGSGCLVTSQLPDNTFGYVYVPLAASDAGETPELDALNVRVNAVEDDVLALEADMTVFPAVRQANKYLVVNDEGTGYVMSNESTTDVQSLAAFAEGTQTGDALINIKAIGGQTRITAGGMEQDATSTGNTLILNPLAGFNRSIKMPHIADHDVSPLPADHVREGMVMTVLNRGTGRARLEAQGSDRIDNNGVVHEHFQMESKQGVILFPARYDAGEHRSQYMIMAKFKIDAFPDEVEGYDDTEVRTLITTNTTDIADHETRIGAIEAFGEHPELPEMAGNEGKLLAIADDGSSYVASGFTQDAAATMMVFGTGCQTGNALINQKCSGADTALTGNEVTQEYFCTGNVIMCTPSNGTTQQVNMGHIAPYQSTELTATQVREGGTIKVVNLGAGSLRLEPPAGTFIQDGTTGNALAYNIGGRRTVEFFPAIFDDGTARYIAISNIPNWIPV